MRKENEPKPTREGRSVRLKGGTLIYVSDINPEIIKQMPSGSKTFLDYTLIDTVRDLLKIRSKTPGRN